MTSFRAEYENWGVFDGRPLSAHAWSIAPHRSSDWLLGAISHALLDDDNLEFRAQASAKKRAPAWEAEAVEQPRALICAFFHDPPCYLEHGGFLIRGTWVCFNHLADAFLIPPK